MSQRRTTQAQRRKAPPIKKPFPVGFAVGCTALAVVLIGTLTYAATNQGVGDHSGLAYAQKQIPGIVNASGLKKNHVSSRVPYPNEKNTPPVGGNHNSLPQTCQVYDKPIANEHAVHDLEHGVVWLTYNPDKLRPDDIARLRDLVAGNDHRVMSPYPGLKGAVSLQAWGEQVFVDYADVRIMPTWARESRLLNGSCLAGSA